MRYISVLILAAASLAFGCGNENVGPCDHLEGEPASIEIGGGDPESGFIEIDDGAAIEASLGPLGQYVVLLKVRASGMHPGDTISSDPSPPEVEVGAYLGARQIGWPYGGIALEKTETGLESFPIMMQFEQCDEASPSIDCLYGETVVLRAQISDMCENSAADELSITLCNSDEGVPCSM